jgi:hypothetical protein
MPLVKIAYKHWLSYPVPKSINNINTAKLRRSGRLIRRIDDMSAERRKRRIKGNK